MPEDMAGAVEDKRAELVEMLSEVDDQVRAGGLRACASAGAGRPSPARRLALAACGRQKQPARRAATCLTVTSSVQPRPNSGRALRWRSSWRPRLGDRLLTSCAALGVCCACACVCMRADRQIADLFLSEAPVPGDALEAGIRRATLAQKFQPVFMGSAFKNKGAAARLARLQLGAVHLRARAWAHPWG